MFDILVLAQQQQQHGAQYVTFCSILRQLLRDVPEDTANGGGQHQLWNRALAMYGKRHPKVMPACLPCFIRLDGDPHVLARTPDTSPFGNMHVAAP